MSRYQKIRCTAEKSTQAGVPCGNWAMVGQTVCRYHGGAAAQNKGAAARRRTERELRDILARLDVAPVQNPLEALRQLAGEVTWWKNALAGRVNDLTSIRYESETGGEQLRSEIALFERAMDRCATVLGTIARLNIDERLAAISEQQIEAFLGAIEAALNAAGVREPAQRTAAKTAAAAQLRRIG